MNVPSTCKLAAVALLLAAMGGCARKTERLSTMYGGRRGEAASSVNGLSILAEMFQQAGYQVSSRSNAGSGIDEAQVIIWAPNNFAPPTQEERDLIESWLAEESGRSFVYIGRDYDAAVSYWQRVAAEASPAEFEAAAREAALAQSAHDTQRSAIPNTQDCDWFTVHRDRPRRRIGALSGDWSSGIDASKSEIILRAEFDPSDEPQAAEEEGVEEEGVEEEGVEEEGVDDAPDADVAEAEVESYEEENDYSYRDEFSLYYEVLLAADDGMSTSALVTRVTSDLWGGSQLLVVTNGSFLLNLPLVNHEHRKLAGRLIDECGPTGRVVIWESDTFRATSSEQENDWSVMTTWPLNFILLHLAVLGMLYLLWRFPIFGLPHQIRGPATSDFAKHVDALGKLMAATKDEAYAQRKVAEYRERLRDT
jgi:hypothetical protein